MSNFDHSQSLEDFYVFEGVEVLQGLEIAGVCLALEDAIGCIHLIVLTRTTFKKVWAEDSTITRCFVSWLRAGWNPLGEKKMSSEAHRRGLNPPRYHSNDLFVRANEVLPLKWISSEYQVKVAMEVLLLFFSSQNKCGQH